VRDHQLHPVLDAATHETMNCRRVGQFVAKGGCFALHDPAGGDVWLEINPIPLHLLDEEVEIVGQHFGPELVYVKSIRPTSGLV
jgi:hypothetical protein